VNTVKLEQFYLGIKLNVMHSPNVRDFMKLCYQITNQTIDIRNCTVCSFFVFYYHISLKKNDQNDEKRPRYVHTNK